MLLSDFDFALPPELVAQEPLADRAASRMLHLSRRPAHVADRSFREFPALLRENDLVVFNNTRVIPARLFGRRSGARARPVSPRNRSAREFLTGEVEVLLTQRLSEWDWECLARPGRKLGVGERITFGDEEDALTCKIIARGAFGERTVRFTPVGDFMHRLERIGHIPLPPYIARQDTAADRERYQTVYAQNLGAAAAPTAGLHFTSEILDEIHQRGVETAEITLHVGLGTFQPLRDPQVEANHLHRERFAITTTAAAQLLRARREHRRIVAVGTTTVRTLEFAAAQSGDSLVGAQEGEADIFIYPGFRFRIVDALLTNFHLPQSSLLMLVSAFAGRDLTLAAYQHAVARHYRFFSYGDCMFIE